MAMEFENAVDGDGGTGRRWLAGLAATMLVAAAGGAGFGLGYALGSDRTAEPASATEEPSDAADADEATGEAGDSTTDAAAEVATTEAPPPAVGAEPAATDVAVAADESPGPATTDPSQDAPAVFDVPHFGTPHDPFAPMPDVYSRTTDEGLTLRVQRGEEWPTAGGYIGGWTPPGWCSPAGLHRVTLVGEGVVDLATVPWYRELYEGRATTLLLLGYVDAAPHQVLVVQTAPGIDSVSVAFGDGGFDQAPTVDGLAVLVAPGPTFAEGEHPWERAANDGYEVTLLAGGDAVGVMSGGLDMWDDAGFRQSCQPPPPELPAPGAQPADPAAAEAEIRAAMEALYGGGATAEDNAVLLDDPTGVAEARQQVRDGGYEAEAASAEAIIEELVFTTPEEAWFRYRIETSGLDLDGRFGTAVVVDDTWRITRGTVCQDLSMAGGDCGSWQPIVLPPR